MYLKALINIIFLVSFTYAMDFDHQTDKLNNLFPENENFNSDQCELNPEPFVHNNFGMFVDKTCNLILVVTNFKENWNGESMYELGPNQKLHLVNKLKDNYYKSDNNYVTSFTHTTSQFQCETILHNEEYNSWKEMQLYMILITMALTMGVGLFKILSYFLIH
ncbi:hypothetical protein CPAV1605_9 [seawater metagenome]|uniref:Uncharacterized protein n=1 Tax=seawater metagenome TaxID=1561972 RepID=A0A5E8CI34_9ZZZZ